MNAFEEEAVVLKKTYAMVSRDILLVEKNAGQKITGIREAAAMGSESQDEISMLQMQRAIIRKEMNTLREILPELYFGRMDFRERDAKKAVSYYIGKRGYQNHGIIILDWRAPAASMFYSHNNTYAVYLKNGVQKYDGDLQLIRHLKVKHDTLEEAVDVINKKGAGKAVPAAGQKSYADFLQERLGRRGKKRLEDVVTTLHADQDRLIRAPIDHHLIIQGGAGTGKTIVLLHHAAYLLYADNCRPSDVLVLAPSRLLLDQVAGILPDLQVNGIEQLTIWDLFRRLLNDTVRIERLGFASGFPCLLDVPSEKREAVHKYAAAKGALDRLAWLDAILAGREFRKKVKEAIFDASKGEQAD